MDHQNVTKNASSVVELYQGAIQVCVLLFLNNSSPVLFREGLSSFTFSCVFRALLRVCTRYLTW